MNGFAGFSRDVPTRKVVCSARTAIFALATDLLE